jgi:hypothetical protein
LSLISYNITKALYTHILSLRHDSKTRSGKEDQRILQFEHLRDEGLASFLDYFALVAELIGLP